MIIKDALVEGSRNLDCLLFYNVHQQCTVHGPLPCILNTIATAVAGIELVPFGSAAKRPTMDGIRIRHVTF